MIVWDQRVIRFVSERLPHDPGHGLASGRGAGVVRGNRLVAGVVFHDWDKATGTVEMTVAADRKIWATWPDIEELGRYAFGFARMVTARTSEKNEPVRRFWRRIGGTEHLIPHLWGQDIAGVILTLEKEQFYEGRQSTSRA